MADEQAEVAVVGAGFAGLTAARALPWAGRPVVGLEARDGVHVGQGGQRLSLPLPAGRHQLTVSQKGKRLVRREVDVVRGKANSETVWLEPTPQRHLSELLFIAGGAGVGALVGILFPPSIIGTAVVGAAVGFLVLGRDRGGDPHGVGLVTVRVGHPLPTPQTPPTGPGPGRACSRR